MGVGLDVRGCECVRDVEGNVRVTGKRAGKCVCDVEGNVRVPGKRAGKCVCVTWRDRAGERLVRCQRREKGFERQGGLRILQVCPLGEDLRIAAQQAHQGCCASR